MESKIRPSARPKYSLLRTVPVVACLIVAAAITRPSAADDTPAGKSGSSTQAPHAVHVSRAVLNTYVGKYMPEQPPGAPPPPPGLPPIDVAADDAGLWVTFSARVRELPLTEVEFFNPEAPNSRIKFTKDAKGKVTGFLMTGLETNLGGPPELKVVRLPD